MKGNSNRRSNNRNNNSYNNNNNNNNNNQEEQRSKKQQQQPFTSPEIQSSAVTQRRQTTPVQRSFGKQQSNLAKSVGSTQKSYAKTKGPNKPSVATNAQKNNPRAQLPNLDDINQEFQGNDRRRQVDYNDYYGTTDAVSNPIKDRLKRSKLRKKKGTGLLSTVDNTSGNSVLDSYRSLGRKLIR